MVFSGLIEEPARLCPLRFWVNVAIHFARPLQEAPELVTLPPEEFPELEKADTCHLDAGVGLDAPKQVRAAPGSEAMSPGGVPDEA